MDSQIWLAGSYAASQSDARFENLFLTNMDINIEISL